MSTVGSTGLTGSKSRLFDEDKVLNFNTTNDELFQMIDKVYGDKGTTADQMKFNKLLQDRTEKASMISQLMRTMSELKRSIIQNLR